MTSDCDFAVRRFLFAGLWQEMLKFVYELYLSPFGRYLSRRVRILRKYLALVGSLALGLTVLAGPAFASDSTVIESTIQWQRIDQPLVVELAGTNMVILRLRAESTEMSAFAHRELIYRRLGDVLQASMQTGNALTSKDVRVVLPGQIDDVALRYPAVFIGDHLIVEADPAHAAINYSTNEALAKVWAQNLGRALDRWAALNFR